MKVTTSKAITPQVPNQSSAGEATRPANTMSLMTDAQLAQIVASGISSLPSQPTEQDYQRYAAARDAQKEILRRSLAPSKATFIFPGAT